MTDQATLIRSLQHPAVYGGRCSRVALMETHISYVLLTGAHAYKIKKAVALDFLDFTTLAARRFFCHEEIRLNRRFAPALYLDVVPITGSAAAPQIGGGGPAIEYAVRMREFPQTALFSRIADRGELTAAHIDALARIVGELHTRAESASAHSSFGTADEVLAAAVQNFTQTRPLVADPADRAALDDLSRWTEGEHAARAARLAERRRAGFIRECHGDLHLGNIAFIDGAPTLFDGIEFNAGLRWIDVMSDVAFVVMDLKARGRHDLAFRFLNGYLEQTGDYRGLALFRFYLAYRAMVRAKVARLRANQDGPGRRAHAGQLSEYRQYVALARSCSQPKRGGIVITHGPSGCGKTTLTQALLELAGAIRIRTDVERKRLHGLSPDRRSGSALGEGLYTETATAGTYSRVASLTREAVSGGFVAIVDGAFLQRAERDRFRQLAAELAVPIVILSVSAREETLRWRIRERNRLGADASEADAAVLGWQLRALQPLDPEERRLAVIYDAEAPLDAARSIATWQSVFDRLGLRRLAKCSADLQVRRVGQA